MPAIWSSSERPISVRTVLVDGVRHAILTPDDPAILHSRPRRRPQTSPGGSKSYPRLNYHCRVDSSFEDPRSAEALDSCFVKLHVVVNKRERENETRIIRRQSAPPQCSRGTIVANPRNLLELRLNGSLNFTEDYSGIDATNEQSDRSDRRDSSGESIDLSTKNSITTCENHAGRSNEDCEDNCEKGTGRTPEIHSNLLSERVLQWMDLSGRASDYRCDESREQEPREVADRAMNLAKAKGSRREYNAVSTKEQVVVQNYKMQTERKARDNEARHARSEQRGIPHAREDSARKTSTTKEEINGENATRSNDLPWSSIGRPQLHIFMPDLNSSGEDASSEESLTKD